MAQPGTKVAQSLLFCPDSALMLRRRFCENRLQKFPLNRLLQNRCIAKPRINAFHAVAGHKNKWNGPILQHFNQWINHFAAEIYIEYRRVD